VAPEQRPETFSNIIVPSSILLDEIGSVLLQTVSTPAGQDEGVVEYLRGNSE
jgi:hypothetical protein